VPLEIDEHLALAGSGMSDSTRHHNCVALERLQKFALEYKLLDKPVFGILEKPRVGRRDRVPTPAETNALLARASPQFRLIYSPTSVGRIRACEIKPACRGIWCCTWPATSAARHIVGRLHRVIHLATGRVRDLSFLSRRCCVWPIGAGNVP
jgi:hypothetical protein